MRDRLNPTPRGGTGRHTTGVPHPGPVTLNTCKDCGAQLLTVVSLWTDAQAQHDRYCLGPHINRIVMLLQYLFDQGHADTEEPTR